MARSQRAATHLLVTFLLLQKFNVSVAFKMLIHFLCITRFLILKGYTDKQERRGNYL